AGTLIEVHEHERNRGVAAARNTGISVCNHELVALLDSDDVWLPNHLETLWEAMSASNAKVVQSRERWFRKGRRVNPKQYHLPPQGDIFEPSLARCLVSSSAVLFEKALFEAVGRYDPRLPACEDYDLWLRMALVADFGLADQETIEKDGGRSDQLSLRYWGMDRFRVFALVKLLDEALTDGQAELVEETALGKLEVLHAGAAKRGKVEDAEGYARWVDAIRRRDRTARGCSDRQTMSLPGALENAGFDWVRRADDPILSALREAE
ncbi:MAG: glycosyltransferase, partial [Myxococcales bacterium]|nr:glycosyltransferase [Myxococcales bacterium]